MSVLGIPVSAVSASVPIDLRIVVDMSKPMLDEDPRALRGKALEYLIQATPDNGMAGIWSYADYIRIIAKHQTSGGLWKQVASIKSSGLVSDGTKADLAGGLKAATWDLGKENLPPAHVVVLSNGAMRTGKGPQEDAAARMALLSQWAVSLAGSHVKVHTIGIGSLSNDSADLLRQLAELSGGRHYQVKDAASLQTALLALTRSIRNAPLARIDATGRFNVAPGAQKLTFTWMDTDSSAPSPKIEQPDGQIFTRMSSVEDGRWVVASNFEIVTINSPQPGWWAVDGAQPDNLSVFGEIEIEAKGISSTVVPSDENSVRVRLSSGGEVITNLDFLALLHIRAWVVFGTDREPLPIDIEGDTFVAHFVNLANGPHTFEFEVTAPTFTRHFEMPFLVANPLLVEIRNSVEEGMVAWLQFSHPELDYSRLKVSGIVRKPPHIASIVPASRMPGGLWKIPLGNPQGIIEVAFTVAGTYLNGKGVYVKTSVHAVTVPLEEGQEVVLRYDGNGKLLATPVPQMLDFIDEPESNGNTPNYGLATADALVDTQPPVTAEPQPPSLPLLPLWFVALIAVLNLAIGGVIWWLNKPRALPFTPLEVIEPV